MKSAGGRERERDGECGERSDQWEGRDDEHRRRLRGIRSGVSLLRGESACRDPFSWTPRGLSPPVAPLFPRPLLSRAPRPTASRPCKTADRIPLAHPFRSYPAVWSPLLSLSVRFLSFHDHFRSRSSVSRSPQSLAGCRAKETSCASLECEREREGREGETERQRERESTKCDRSS